MVGVSKQIDRRQLALIAGSPPPPRDDEDEDIDGVFTVQDFGALEDIISSLTGTQRCRTLPRTLLLSLPLSASHPVSPSSLFSHTGVVSSESLSLHSWTETGIRFCVGTRRRQWS